jgi:hypothetical protein
MLWLRRDRHGAGLPALAILAPWRGRFERRRRRWCARTPEPHPFVAPKSGKSWASVGSMRVFSSSSSRRAITTVKTLDSAFGSGHHSTICNWRSETISAISLWNTWPTITIEKTIKARRWPSPFLRISQRSCLKISNGSRLLLCRFKLVVGAHCAFKVSDRKARAVTSTRGGPMVNSGSIFGGEAEARGEIQPRSRRCRPFKSGTKIRSEARPDSNFTVALPVEALSD